MLVKEFDYRLPQELIAQTPLEKRDESRLMVVDRAKGSFAHKKFRDLLDYVTPQDLLVLNDTKVLPARLYGRRPTGGKTEILLLKEVGDDLWECLVRPGSKVREGDNIFIADDFFGHVRGTTEYGGRIIHWTYEGDFMEQLLKHGRMPLPPYIKTALFDDSRYQTVYAETPGSAAAPTAGLHFTDDLLKTLHKKGVSTAKITLNVGLDTFRPVKEEKIEDHKMHREFYSISQGAADEVFSLRQRGGKLFAVGTTVVRTLESAKEEGGAIKAENASTDLFIVPGYEFQVVDRLITNFHLPKSTLLMLISAFAGHGLIMEAYEEAVKERYRFFSFGDAMLII